ncbi:MAG: methyl-accepting chemotaxis protein [Halobacteriota archaeon]
MKLGEEMKLGLKLFACFAVVLLLTTALSVFAVMQIGVMSTKSEVMEQAGERDGAIQTVRQEEKNFLLRGDSTSIDKTNKAVAEVKSLGTELQVRVTDTESKAALEAGLASIPKYESAFLELQTLTKTKNDLLANAEEDAHKVESAIKASALDEMTKDKLIMDVQNIRGAEKSTINAGIDAYLKEVNDYKTITRSITGPVAEVVKVTGDVAVGNLNTEFTALIGELEAVHCGD